MTIAPVNNILRSISKARSDSDIKLNILTACRNNEKYIALLAQTKHNFYILKEHKWNHLIEQCPSNVQTLNEWSEPLDYIICYDRAEQYDEMSSMSQRLHVPIILIDMCSKMGNHKTMWIEYKELSKISNLKTVPSGFSCNLILTIKFSL